MFITIGGVTGTRRELPIVWDAQPPLPQPPPIPEMVTSVEVAFYSTSDDKDPEDTVNVSVLADDVEVASYHGSAGERWPNWSGPYPCRYINGRAPFWLHTPDWSWPNQGNDSSPRTFALQKQVQPGQAIRGRLALTKTGTDQGWNFRVELYANTTKGHRLRYDNNWSDSFKGGRQSQSWTFNW